MATTVSIYKNIRENKSTDTIPIDIFLDYIKTGKWQDQVLRIRCIQDYTERKLAKEKMPYVTLSGMFAKERKAAEITNHSGFIGMDIDNIANELEGIRQLLSSDPYVYAIFTIGEVLAP